MTGWQGNDGGWGPRGGDQPPYGEDPYYAQPDPYVGYQTGGFPAPGYGPPPPPGRQKLPMILGVLAIVVIVGAVVAIVLVNRSSSGTPTAAPVATSSGSTPEPTTGPTASSGSSAPSTSDGPETRDGWQKVDNTTDSGLTYEVPPEWQLGPAERSSGLNVNFTGTADYGSYECEGKTYVRTFATSGDVLAKSGADLDLKETVTDFAASFGRFYYNQTAKVDVPEPTELEVDGRPAMTLSAKVTPQVTVPACEASEGEVALVGVLLEEEGEPSGVAMLVVVGDAAGGPADPAPLPKSVAQEILASVSVG